MDFLLPIMASSLEQDLVVVLTLFYFLWIFSWGKKVLGSAKLAVLFALIITYLVFFLHPELVWIPVVIFFVATFGTTLFDKVQVFKGKE